MSKVNICNKAIIYASINEKIDDFENNDSPIGKSLRIIFDDTVKLVLTKFNWGFCQRFLSPVKLKEINHENWRYVYQYPNNVLLINKITSNKQEISYTEGTIDYQGKIVRCLFTEQSENIEINGTTYIDDVALYPHYIRELIELELAIQLALEYAKELKLIQMLKTQFKESLKEAKTIDLKNVKINHTNTVSRYERARG